MKKLLIISYLIFFATCAFANSANHPIDTEEQECLKNNLTTSGMNRCIIISITQWENQISDIDFLITQKLSKRQLKEFKKTNNSWQKYYKQEKKLIFDTIYKKDGTIHTNIALANIKQIAKQRALYLQNYLFDLSE